MAAGRRSLTGNIITEPGKTLSTKKIKHNFKLMITIENWSRFVTTDKEVTAPFTIPNTDWNIPYTFKLVSEPFEIITKEEILRARRTNKTLYCLIFDFEKHESSKYLDLKFKNIYATGVVLDIEFCSFKLASKHKNKYAFKVEVDNEEIKAFTRDNQLKIDVYGSYAIAENVVL